MIVAISGIRNLVGESYITVEETVRKEAAKVAAMRFGGAIGVDTVALAAVSLEWRYGLLAAAEAVASGAAWASPHLKVQRLTEGATAAVLAGEAWGGQPTTQRPYRGLLGGGFVAGAREVIHSIPLDERFTGWG